MVKSIDRFLLGWVAQPVANRLSSPFRAAQRAANAGAVIAVVNAAISALMLNLSPLFGLPLALAATFVLYRLAGRLHMTVVTGEENALGRRIWPVRIAVLIFFLFALAPILVFGKSVTTILVAAEVGCYLVSIYLVSCRRVA